MIASSLAGETKVKILCELNLKLLEPEFGLLNTSEVVLTPKRAKHIMERHPSDYALFEAYGIETITESDIIIRDMEHENTVFMVLKLEVINMNAIVRLSIAGVDDDRLKNSVMTFYRIRTKNLAKLVAKHKVLYIRGEQ